MATYIESALWDFIKSILTKGIKTLTSARFFPYTSFLLLIVATSTIATFTQQIIHNFTLPIVYQDYLLFIEISAAITFLITGFFLGRLKTLFQIPFMVALTILLFFGLYSGTLNLSYQIASYSASILYFAWILIITFSTFALFRDLFANEVFGTVLFLGKPEDDGNVLFSVICWILAFLNVGLGYFIFTHSKNSTPLLVSSVVIILFSFIAVLPLLGIQRKHDVFYTIISTFYMFATIRIALLALRVLTASSGTSSTWDSLFSLFMALYAIQGAAVKGVKLGSKTELKLKVEDTKEGEIDEGLGISRTLSRLFTDRGIVLIILGIVMGYHSMQIQTRLGRGNVFQSLSIFSGSNLVLLGYELNIMVSLLIYILAFVAFIFISKFRNYASPKIRRIPWAPPYNDLKIMVEGIKSGDVSWKVDAIKLAGGVTIDAIKKKLGYKTSSGNRISGTFNKWIHKAKDEDND